MAKEKKALKAHEYPDYTAVLVFFRSLKSSCMQLVNIITTLNQLDTVLSTFCHVSDLIQICDWANTGG